MPRQNNRFYDLLEASPNATPDGLQHAYTRVAARLAARSAHGETAATERLAQVEKAWGVLSDPATRRVYDAHGEAGLEAGSPPQSGWQLPGEATRGVGPPSGFGPTPGYTPAPGEVRRTRPSTGTPIWIPFRRACLGGQGEAMLDEGLIEVTIPPGTADGDVLESGPHRFVARVDPNPGLRRAGLDLHTTLSLSPDELRAGCEVVVRALEGHLKVAVPAGIKAGQKLKVAGHGVPSADGLRGDLVLTVAIGRR